MDEAIDFINARPKPLALYVCSSSRATFKKGILMSIRRDAVSLTISGGRDNQRACDMERLLLRPDR